MAVEATRRDGLSTIDISKQLITCSVNDKINTSRKLVHVHTECARSPVTHFYSSLNEAIFHMNLSFIEVQKKKENVYVCSLAPSLQVSPTKLHASFVSSVRASCPAHHIFSTETLH
jgi:hypothetical protein